MAAGGSGGLGCPGTTDEIQVIASLLQTPHRALTARVTESHSSQATAWSRGIPR